MRQVRIDASKDATCLHLFSIYRLFRKHAVKSFYLYAGPVIYRVCSKIETFARPCKCVSRNFHFPEILYSGSL